MESQVRKVLGPGEQSLYFLKAADEDSDILLQDMYLLASTKFANERKQADFNSISKNVTGTVSCEIANC